MEMHSGLFISLHAEWNPMFLSAFEKKIAIDQAIKILITE